MKAVKKNTPTVTERLLSVTDLLRGRQYLLVTLDMTHRGFLGAAHLSPTAVLAINICLPHSNGSPDRVILWSRWFEMRKMTAITLHTFQNKIQNKKQKPEGENKRFRNIKGILIVPKSAGLFLINLDDVLVLHAQLRWANSRTQQRGFYCFVN